MSETKKNEGIGRLVVVLGLITLVCALLLGVVNQVTAPQIEQNNINTRNAAMAELIAGAEFEDMNVTEPATKEEPTGISGVYKATIDGQDAGYCVEVQPSGFGGVMTLIVGVNADGTIAGAKVTAHGETPGLGATARWRSPRTAATSSPSPARPSLPVRSPAASTARRPMSQAWVKKEGE